MTMNPPSPQNHPAYPGPERSRSTADLVATLILDGVLLLAAGAASFFGFLGAAFAGDACASGPCTGVGTGVAVLVFAPPIIALLAIAASIVLLVLRLLAWWVPVAGFAVMIMASVMIGPALMGIPLL